MHRRPPHERSTARRRRRCGPAIAPVAIALLAPTLWTPTLRAQVADAPPASPAPVAEAVPATMPAATLSDKLKITGDEASAWSEGATRILLIENQVSIETDDAKLSADRAVVWLTPIVGGVGYDVKIALAGNARVERDALVRTGGELYVTLASRPEVSLNVGRLDRRDRGTSVGYLLAAQLRRATERGEAERPFVRQPAAPQPTPALPATMPSFEAATQPTTRRAVAELPPPRQATISYRSDSAATERTPDGRLALVLSGNVQLIQEKANGDRVEMQAQNAVLFTNWADLKPLLQGGDVVAERDFDSAYLEKDVRLSLLSADPTKPEQSLAASRVVYEFATDRAVLTDALLHSYDPTQAAPLVVRAREMRKLDDERYEARGASITTSNLATPSLSLSATKVAVRQAESPDGTRTTTFSASNVTPRLFGVPVFYLPYAFGSTSDNGVPLRAINLTHSSAFGTGVSTTWGLYETLGQQPPAGFDASYGLDYYTQRGPAAGFDASYAGSAITESTLQPWSYEGGLTLYGVLDDGSDRLGRNRGHPSFDNDFRGRVRWNHQQFLADGWQLQAQAAYTSDPSFLEQWFRNEFRNGLEQDSSILVKRSVGNEVLSLYANQNFSDVATTADQLQEVTPNRGNFSPLVVERLPQVEYHKLGESFGDDRFTWVSNNSAAGLQFNRSYSTLGPTSAGVPNIGLRNQTNRTPNHDDGFPGLPSYGYTGYTGDYVIRGDTRQEVAMPLGDDRFRMTPYGVLRYTAYSDSPGGGSENRLLGGVGVRMSTQFSRVFDGFNNDLLDIHRMRHIVEPQLNLWAAAQTRQREDLYIYDENVDGITDAAAASFVIKQRFQTKRGGPERYRSVDFLTLNTGVTVFGNQPDEPTSPIRPSVPEFTTANAFRGVFYESMPEASVARSTAFADATWRVTDTTALLGDTSWNLDTQTLDTAAAGLAVERDPRVRYFGGLRYVGELNSLIGTFNVDYNLSERYSLAFNQTFNFSEGQSQSTSVELIRRFEQFVVTLDVYFDRIEDEGGIQLSIDPRNFPGGPSLRGRGQR